MDHERIEEMFQKKQYVKVIQELKQPQNEGQVDEYCLIRLLQARFMNGERDTLFRDIFALQKEYGENGEYGEETERLFLAIRDDNADEYIEQLYEKFGDGEKKTEQMAGEITERFKTVVGGEAVKKSLQAFMNSLDFEKCRVANEYPEVLETTHLLIVGERGSGKSMFSDIIADFLFKNGIRTMDEIYHFIARDNIDEKNITKLKEKKDCTIIIENIEDWMFKEELQEYQKKNLLNTLEKFMEEEKSGLTVIITGSQSAVEKMKYLNKTIEDQFFDEIYLEPYSTDDLFLIMELLANKKGFHIHDSCMGNLKSYINTQRKASGFLNTIALNRYLDGAKKKLADRYVDRESELDENERNVTLYTFMPEDFETESDQNVKELYKELEQLHGLETVKAEVKQQMDRIKVEMIARQAGASGNDRRGTLHTIYMGDPGTGKTTVAELVGKIYCAMGLLPKGNQEITTVSRADLVACYLGHTARLVKEVCERSDGGVLFIDEAYSLFNSSNDTFGKEAVDTLIQELENRRDSMMIILAGYEKEMEEFLKTNPGFKSRVPNVIHFDNYNVADMVSIFEEMMVKDNFYWTVESSREATRLVTNLVEAKSKEPDFGNARGVRNLYEKIKSIQRGRLARELEELKNQGNLDVNSLEYDVFTREDIQEASDSILKEGKSIEELLAELNGLTGLEGVKCQVADMVSSMNYIKLAKSRNIDLGRNQGTLHMVFSGNPGTGKTTVARLLGEIYVKLGVLKKSTFIQAERSDLIGQWQGHTAQLVANKAAEADGGILFIDEAYQLCLDELDSFGNEAVGTLLSLVEEKRDSLMVILAGYSDNMESFLRINPGLRSRFPNVIEFTDYTLDEMVEILDKNCQKESMVLEEGVKQLVKDQIEGRVKKDQREFANARGVRNLMDQIILRQRARIVRENADGKVLTDVEFLMIKKEDVIVSK